MRQNFLPPFRLPIRIKITLPYIFLALIISVGIGVVFTRVILENVNERFTNLLYGVGKLAADGMVDEETRLLGTLRLLSNTDSVGKFIQQNDVEGLRNSLLGVVVNNREETVEILNDNGDLVLSMHHVAGGRVEEYTFSSGGGLTIKDWELVKKVLSGQDDLNGDKFSGIVKTGWGDYFYVAGPVFENGQLAGVILLGKSLQSLVVNLHTITTAQITLYDLKGLPLASTFSTPLAITPDLTRTILTFQDTNGYHRNLDSHQLGVGDLSYEEALGPWEARKGSDLGLLGAGLAKNLLVTTSVSTRWMMAVLIMITVFLIVILGINLATHITHPLLTLAQASREVAQGDLKIQVPPTTSDEIADLTQSFNHMVSSLLQSKMDLVEAYENTLLGWSEALELREKETHGHTNRVTNLTVELARRLNLSEEQIENIRRGAILHDIGKMGISDEILLKPAPLTPEECEIMRQHPQSAYDMLKSVAYLVPALDIPYAHHEKWDGSGYPRGLKADEIPLPARLFAIVDVWDTLTSDRPQHDALTDEEAFKIIFQESGAQFDPDLVQHFALYLSENNKNP